jgi:hypothetical protein
MAFTLEDSYEGSDDAQQSVFSTNWSAQTFTTGVSGYTLSKAGIKGGVRGTPSVPKLEIYATSGGKPTGSALATATMVVGDMPDYTTPDWYEVEMDSPYTLSGSTQYALVMNCSGSSANRLGWQYDNSAPSYTGGAFNFSSSGGSSWTTVASYDFLFRLYSGSAVTYNDLAASGSIQFTGTAGLEIACIVDLAASGEIEFLGTANLSVATITQLAASGVISFVGTADLLGKTNVKGLVIGDTNLIIGFGNNELWYEDV